MKLSIPASIDECVAWCPNCKTFETLYFTDQGMLATQKFVQTDSVIYHDCGSIKPCRLYRHF